MNPGKNKFWAKYGRHITMGAVAFALAAVVTFVQWRQEHKTVDTPPQLTGIASQMRRDTKPWSHKERDASAMMQDIRDKKAAAIGVTMNAILVSTKDGSKYFVTDKYATFSQALLLGQVKDSEKSPDYQLVWLPEATIGTDSSGVGSALIVVRDLANLLLPLLMIGGMVWFMRREMKGGAGLLEKAPALRFDDVIGAGEAKAALADIQAYLKDPKAFTKMGLRPPCGVLMVGGPGVGKTRLAQALAGECNANFISITGSYFSAKYYGVGIQKVKHLFKLARQNGPTIVFIDEADGWGKRTDTSGGPAEAESNRIINQLLAEMDGFESNEGVILVAATNHPENIDEALRRPGRFDRQVQVRLPDVADRAKIFEFYVSKLPSRGTDVDFEQLARLTTGLSPATLSMIVNQAGLLARKAGVTEVSAAHFREAIKIARIGDVSGAEKALDPEEVKRVAVHEGGHAVVAALLGAGVLEEITILPRGGALGFALITKPQDKHLYRETELEKELMVLLGGRNAELLMYGEASSGAAQDLQEASRISLDMVSRFGFNKDGNLFSLAALPPQYAGLQMTNAIEQSNQLLKEVNDRCAALLKDNKHVLSAVMDELLKSETVPGSYVYDLIKQEPAKEISLQGAE